VSGDMAEPKDIVMGLGARSAGLGVTSNKSAKSSVLSIISESQEESKKDARSRRSILKSQKSGSSSFNKSIISGLRGQLQANASMNSGSIEDDDYEDGKSSEHQEHLFRGYNSPTQITLAAPKPSFRPQSAQVSGQKRRANPQTDTFEVRSSISASRNKPSITLDKINKKPSLSSVKS
jgi:hypothetical protein